jgi:hypothetical protein
VGPGRGRRLLSGGRFECRLYAASEAQFVLDVDDFKPLTIRVSLRPPEQPDDEIARALGRNLIRADEGQDVVVVAGHDPRDTDTPSWRVHLRESPRSHRMGYAPNEDKLWKRHRLPP